MDVYERLKAFAQQYSTGRGDWDFGVAVQILLDNFESSKLALQEQKLDYIVAMMQRQDLQEELPQEEGTELLGGARIDKNGEIHGKIQKSSTK